MRRAFTVGLIAASVGCAGSPPAYTITHMDSVAVTSGGIAFRVFPELPRGQGSGASASSVLPSDSAPPCADFAPAPEAWPLSRAATPSRHVAAVSLRLPGRFVLDQSRHVTAESEQFGGINIGAWHDTAGTGPNGFPHRPMLAIWVDEEAGYPTIGADTASRQMSIEECIAANPAARTRVVKFELETPEGRQSAVGAVWPIGAGRYLRLLGSSPDASGIDTLLLALGSVRVERR